jgi:hypothetical protein
MFSRADREGVAMGTKSRRPVGPTATGQDSPGRTRLVREVPSTLELVFESTRGFEDDIGRIPAESRSRVVDEINDRCRMILEDRPAFEANLSRPFDPPVPDALQSTLSVMAIREGYRVILAVDDDPLFGRVLVTLLRVVEAQDETVAYRSAASMLYDRP